MAEECEKSVKRNLFQYILYVFDLHIDDLTAPPRQRGPCIVNLLIIAIYYGVSISLLWFEDGALFSAFLNTLCVLRGVCKILFNRGIYQAEMFAQWKHCTENHEDYINNSRKPYHWLYVLELTAAIGFAVTLLIISCWDVVYLVEGLGTFVMCVAFTGDSVDVLTDMYQAHPRRLSQLS